MQSPLADALDPRPVVLETATPPVLVVVVDTEEEFDWNAPFTRSSTGVGAMGELHRAQDLFDELGIRPIYVADYPVVTQQGGVLPLREILTEGRAEVGAHLHPWVSPPFEEEVSRPNSFAGNLPRSLETRKLESLMDRIQAAFGVRPVAYKAGRYGLGTNSPEILEELGFQVDLSVCPAFDFGAEGGPDYSRFTSDPFWFGKSRHLLGLPSTGGYVGFLHRYGADLYRLTERPMMQRARLGGILSRLRGLSRLHLSPEGHSFDELRYLTTSLLHRGLRVFSLSFHSPSLKPGCTPYVRNDSELRTFMKTLRSYCKFFLGELRGRSMTPTELRDFLDSNPRRQAEHEGTGNLATR